MKDGTNTELVGKNLEVEGKERICWLPIDSDADDAAFLEQRRRPRDAQIRHISPALTIAASRELLGLGGRRLGGLIAASGVGTGHAFVEEDSDT